MVSGKCYDCGELAVHRFNKRTCERDRPVVVMSKVEVENTAAFITDAISGYFAAKVPLPDVFKKDLDELIQLALEKVGT